MFQVHPQKLTKVSQLNPSAYNPRSISPQKFEALKNSIKKHGFADPIVVQKKGMNIIGGHQRFRAVKELAMELGESPPDLPCTILDVPDAEAKELNIKLNNAKGDNDARALGELLVDLYGPKVEVITPDIALDLGFEHQELISMHHLIVPLELHESSGSGGEPKTFGTSLTLSLDFDSATMREKVKKKLMDDAKTEKKKTGDVIAALLFPKKKTVQKTVSKVRTKRRVS